MTEKSSTNTGMFGEVIPSEIPSLFPRYYPIVYPECLNVATPFFACITKQSEMLGDDDFSAGFRGAKACHKDQLIYEECMERVLRKKQDVNLKSK